MPYIKQIRKIIFCDDEYSNLIDIANYLEKIQDKISPESKIFDYFASILDYLEKIVTNEEDRYF